MHEWVSPIGNSTREQIGLRVRAGVADQGQCGGAGGQFHGMRFTGVTEGGVRSVILGR